MLRTVLCTRASYSTVCSYGANDSVLYVRMVQTIQKFPTMVPLPFPSGRCSSVVLQSCSNSANLFFNMYLSPLPSISASILVLDELIDFDCSSFGNAVAFVFRYLDRSLSMYRSAFFLRTSRTRLRLASCGNRYFV